MGEKCLASELLYMKTILLVLSNFFSKVIKQYLSPIFLLISNLINKLRLHHFLGTKTTETNQLLKTDANVAY